MSSPQHRNPPAQVRERAACMCASGGSCSVYAPGHALHLIQARLASATPSDWTDAVVESADRVTGEVRLRGVDDGAVIVVWNAAGAAGAVSPGLPVALHARYSVLSVGRRAFNCALLATA